MERTATSDIVKVLLGMCRRVSSAISSTGPLPSTLTFTLCGVTMVRRLRGANTAIVLYIHRKSWRRRVRRYRRRINGAVL